MQNLWLKRCSCGKTAVEFRSRKDLYNDSVRKLYCPSCIKEAEEGTLMLNIRKWGSTTSKISDIGVYGIFYNVEMLKSRNDNYEWSEKEAIETFETGMVRPNLLSSVREDQDYHIYGLLKKGEDPLEYKKRKVSEFKKTAENAVPDSGSGDLELKTLAEEKKELLDLADEVVADDLSSETAQNGSVQEASTKGMDEVDHGDHFDTTYRESEFIQKTNSNENNGNSQAPAPVPLAGKNTDSMNLEEETTTESASQTQDNETDLKGIVNTSEKAKGGFFSKMFNKEEKSKDDEVQTPDSPF